MWIPLFQMDGLHRVVARTLLGGGPLGPHGPQIQDLNSSALCGLRAPKSLSPWDHRPVFTQAPGTPRSTSLQSIWISARTSSALPQGPPALQG